MLGEFIGQPYTWARSHTNGYEVTTKGDQRFSAFCATLWPVTELPAPEGAVWNIEIYYQIMTKGNQVETGNTCLPFHKWWMLGKGRGSKIKYKDGELFHLYVDLWRKWCDNNPELIKELSVLAKGKVLTDQFAKSHINQANALSIILNERFGE